MMLQIPGMHFEYDIPALWTATFHWCAYLLFITLLPKRMSKLPTALIALFLLPVQIALYSVVAPLRGMLFNIGMSLFAVWTLFPFLVLTDCPIRNQIYYCARAFILGGFTASLTWQIYRFYSERHPLLQQTLWETVIVLGLGLLVLLAVWAIERTHRAELREMQIPTRYLLINLAVALFIYILSSLSYTTLETPFTGQSEAEIFNIRTIVYFGGAAIMLAFHIQICDEYARAERDALQHILDQQYANYRVRQETIGLINQKYHDLKHQIAVLRSEIGHGQKVEYLDQLEREIRSYEAQNKTGNEVLDTILTGKSLYCQEHGITLTVVADGHALDFMNVMDLSALLGNALDNAIEAAEQIAEPEQRLILLSVSQQKGFLRIQLKNRYNAAPTVGGIFPETTKSDKRYHGYGLKSIRSTVEKYGGSVALHGESGWFELGILIPYTDAASTATEKHI